MSSINLLRMFTEFRLSGIDHHNLKCPTGLAGSRWITGVDHVTAEEGVPRRVHTGSLRPQFSEGRRLSPLSPR